MKKQFLAQLGLLTVFAIAACSANTFSDNSGVSIDAQTNNSITSTDSEGSATLTQLVTTEATLTASLAETVAEFSDAEINDFDPQTAITIQFDGDVILADSANLSIIDTTVTILKPGDYRLAGNLADGQVVINSDEEGEIRLLLDDVSLSSTTSTPLYIKDAEKVTLILAKNTKNSINDSANYVFATAEETEPNAAIFSDADLVIAGEGTLTVKGNYNDGISSDDSLVVAGGTLQITAIDDGLRGKNYIILTGGDISIDAQGDGLKSDEDADTELGYIAISGGTLSVSAQGDAISAATVVSVSGGSLSLTTGNGATQVVADSTSAKGIKGDTAVIIDGGTINIDAADDALHSNGSISINSGILTLASADDGIHADQTVTINGGEIQITQSYEGVEGSAITINDGSLRILASDDGINVAGAEGGFGMMGGQGGFFDNNAQTGTADQSRYYLSINGGQIFVKASGDGIDIGGLIEMTDGLLLIDGINQRANGPIDYTSGFNISGGTFVATGTADMAMTASQGSSQNAALVYLAAAQASETLISVVDETGDLIFSFQPTGQYQSVAFSSPNLITGKTYTIYTGGSIAAISEDGFSQEGSYTPGNSVGSFTISSIVTSIGSGGRTMPGGRTGNMPPGGMPGQPRP